jgi:hypothetical protein
MTDRPEPATTVRTLRCLECGRAWLEPAERWRLYLTCEEPPGHLAYCPDCAEREFD